MQRRNKIVPTHRNFPVQQWQMDRQTRQFQDFITRYEQLSVEERGRVDHWLRNIYELLGVEPGALFEPGENFFSVLQLLMTNVQDHTVRIGRLENLIENILSGVTPLPQMSLGVDKKFSTPHNPTALQANEELRQTDRQFSTHPSDRQTDARQTTYSQEEIVCVANFQRQYPGASYRETAEFCTQSGWPMGKDKAGKIIEYLKSQGSI